MLTQCPSCGTTNLEGIDQCAFCAADLSGIDLTQRPEPIEPSLMHQPTSALTLTKVEPISPDASISQAIAALMQQKIDMVPIVEAGRLVGVFAMRDLMTRLGDDYRSSLHRPVREFMTRKVEILPPDAEIAFCVNKMDLGLYRTIPLVQDGQLIGMASAMDVIRHLLQSEKADSQRQPTDNPIPPEA